MTEFVPTEKGQTIRYPSTAQLCIDSADRDNFATTGPFDFTITRSYNLLNGFFTRLSSTEVMVDWAEPNIQTGVNDTLVVVISSTNYSVTVPQGFYTVKDILDTLVSLLNSAGTGRTFSIVNTNGQISLNVNTGTYAILVGQLAEQLFAFSVFVPQSLSKLVTEADLRLYRYIDITSNQLTYAQDVKDSATNRTVIDTLCRIYLAYEDSPSYDAYGFPILLGYKATSFRRAFPFPKQIKWANNIPIGNLTFQVFGNITRDGVTTNVIIPFVSYNSNWCLTLQVSEV
jgi:hypothetical protein